ncbi:DUF4097 family beta strand repeat-containing protein [Actinomadura roseirufa]|uniref:DUF4097 family beta strand repeat-containing protein n=1 Tax=Actinomadura roseirufa TaxID=2094049 RepID=UPI0010416C4E|nr:DUF4097 family beta strand repeat-containing protein [Actinomadura roseirufa]
MPAFATPEPITADIQVYVGQVRLHAGDRAETVVDVRPSDPSAEAGVQAAERTIVEFSGGRLLVKGPKPRALGHLLPWRGSIEVTIELPAGSRVEAEVYADFITTGTLGQTVLRSHYGEVRMEEAGPLEVKTSIGDVTVDRAIGPVEATTSTGTIRIAAIDGPGTLKAATGSLVLGEATGDVQLKTGTGDIAIDRVRAGVTAKSANGRIRIDAAISGTVHIENGHGKVGVGIAEGTAAWLDLHTKNGVVRNTLTAAEAPEAADAVVEVHASTNYGDIDIHRS